MKKISNLLILAVLAIGMGLTSCEGALDDILGEWSRPTPGNVTPGKVTAVTITTAPTATAGSILVGSTTALVTAGVADGGTVMYKVTTDNTQPTSTDGFSAEIPTAAALAVGTYFVWYYAKAADTQHTDSEIAATPIEVTVLLGLATPLTLEALTDGTITVTDPKPSMKFSLNGGAKSAVTANPINVYVGDKVQFYGAEPRYSNGVTSTIFGGTAQVKVYGNIMSLLDETDYETKTDLPNEPYVFCWLFYGNAKLTDASGLLMPAMTLAESCYWGMFGDCTALTAAPKLPAKTLAKSCYNGMFYGCTNLTVAPELKAETLAESCYDSMFNGCTNLTTAPELKAETLAKSCCYGMFHGCTSLTVAPELKAETLANNCYEEMFKGCTKLTTAPKLPAMTLASCCYKNMFNGCTKLTTAYVKAGYGDAYCESMFVDCPNVNTCTLYTDGDWTSCGEISSWNNNWGDLHPYE